MEVFESNLRDERCLCERMEEEGKHFGISGVEVGHGRASIGTGRAKLLEFWGFWHGKSGTDVPLQARAVPRYWRFRLNFFFVFLNCTQTITYKTT